jgi:hypothetical protein
LSGVFGAVAESGCERVKFFNGVVAHIRAEKINVVSVLMEFPYGERVDSVDIATPDGPKIWSLP